MFGGDEAFSSLIKECDRRGIKIILDGVFNHTGDDSRYFDKYGKYGKIGAYTNESSEYRDWFSFKKYPGEYESWWGIDILPKLDHSNPDCRNYFVGDGGIVQKYGKMGIGGWRLDVADELPNEFLDDLRTNLRAVNPDGIVIGEVWENASDKISYGKRRRYFGGRQLDSVMNYPFRSALIEYLRYGDAQILADTLLDIYSSYPKQVSDALMNVLGTHDTERIITIISTILYDDLSAENYTNDELAVLRLNEVQRSRAKELLKLAVCLQYTVYGIPSVFYGDETGLEGYHDPFCRRTYPWHDQDAELIEFYRKLGDIRSKHSAFEDGVFSLLSSQGGVISFERKNEAERIIIAANRGDAPSIYSLDGKYYDMLSDKEYGNILPANSAVILIEE
jgi:glycosidase